MMLSMASSGPPIPHMGGPPPPPEVTGKRNGKIVLADFETEEYLAKLDPIVAQLKADVPDAQYDRNSLAQLIVGLLQFQEEVLGKQAAVKVCPKLPAKLFRNLSPTGPLYVIASKCYSLRSARGIKKLEWNNPAKRKENIEMVLGVTRELTARKLLLQPVIWLHANVPDRAQLAAIIKKLGGVLVTVEDDPTVTHKVYPFGPNGDPDDGNQYMRTLEFRGSQARVHWWYLPDSYDESLPAEIAPDKVEPDVATPFGGAWKVYARWIKDSEVYNEWMNPTDYETEEYTEEQEKAEAAAREAAGEPAPMDTSVAPASTAADSAPPSTKPATASEMAANAVHLAAQKLNMVSPPKTAKLSAPAAPPVAKVMTAAAAKAQAAHHKLHGPPIPTGMPPIPTIPSAAPGMPGAAPAGQPLPSMLPGGGGGGGHQAGQFRAVDPLSQTPAAKRARLEAREVVEATAQRVGLTAVRYNANVPYKGAMDGSASIEDISQGQRKRVPGGVPQHAAVASVTPAIPPIPGLATLETCPPGVYLLPACAVARHMRWDAKQQRFAIMSQEEIHTMTQPFTQLGTNIVTYRRIRDKLVAKYREDERRRLTLLVAQRAMPEESAACVEVAWRFLDAHCVINYQALDNPPEEYAANRRAYPLTAPAPGQLFSFARVVSGADGAAAAAGFAISPGAGLPHAAAKRRQTTKVRNRKAGVTPVSGAAPVNGGAMANVAAAAAVAAEPGTARVPIYCTAMPWVECSALRYHCLRYPEVDLCPAAFAEGRFPAGCSSKDFIKLDASTQVPEPGLNGWSAQETLLLLEGLEAFGENWPEVAEHVSTKTQVECILHFLQLPIDENFLDELESGSAPQLPATARIAATTTNPATSLPYGLTVPSPSAAADSAAATPAHDSLPGRAGASGASSAAAALANLGLDLDMDFNLNPNVARELSETSTRADAAAVATAAAAAAGPGVPPALTAHLLDDCIPFADAQNSIMAQVAFLTMFVSPKVAAEAARRALEVLSEPEPGSQPDPRSNGNSYPSNPTVTSNGTHQPHTVDPSKADVMDLTGDYDTPATAAAAVPTASRAFSLDLTSPEKSRVSGPKGAGDAHGADTSRSHIVGEAEGLPLDAPISAVRMRRAAAVAMSAAAVKARELAEEEERSLLRLAAVVCEQQARKVELKRKYLEELDVAIDAECAVLEATRKQLEAERQQLRDSRRHRPTPGATAPSNLSTNPSGLLQFSSTANISSLLQQQLLQAALGTGNQQALAAAAAAASAAASASATAGGGGSGVPVTVPNQFNFPIMSGSSAGSSLQDASAALFAAAAGGAQGQAGSQAAINASNLFGALQAQQQLLNQQQQQQQQQQQNRG